MRPILLPVEIIARIIQLLLDGENVYKQRNLKALLPILQVSPTFRLEAERILYAHLHLESPKAVIQCFKTICNRPHTARAVRSLSVHLSLNSVPPPSIWQLIGLPVPQPRPPPNKNVGRVLMGFGKLVQSTLHRLVNLQDYSLSMGSPHGRDEIVFASPWLPTDVPFRLRRFAIDLNLSEPVKAFLASQPEINHLFATHFHSDRVQTLGPAPAPSTSITTDSYPVPPHEVQPPSLPAEIDDDGFILDDSTPPSPPNEPVPTVAPEPVQPPQKKILPKLQSIIATTALAARLAPTRPVRRICIRDLGRNPTTTITRIVDALPEFARSSTTVKQFDLALWDLQAFPDSILEPLALHLPKLSSIVVRPLSSREEGTTYDIYRSDAFCEPLSAFRDLKQLIVPTPSPYNLLREAGYIHEHDINMPVTIHANINAQVVIGGPGIGGPGAANPATQNHNMNLNPAGGMPLGPMFMHPGHAPPAPANAHAPAYPPAPVVHGPPPPPNFHGPHDPPPPPPGANGGFPLGGILGGLFGGIGGAIIGFGGVAHVGQGQDPAGQPQQDQIIDDGQGQDDDEDDDDGIDIGDDNQDPGNPGDLPLGGPAGLPPFLQQFFGAMGNIPGMQQVQQMQPVNMGGAGDGAQGGDEGQTFVSTFVLHQGPPAPAGANAQNPAGPQAAGPQAPQAANPPGVPLQANFLNALFGGMPPMPGPAGPQNNGNNAQGQNVPPAAPAPADANNPPFNIVNHTFTGFIDPTTGATLSDEAIRSLPRPKPDPKKLEALEKAMRGLQPAELAILDKWKMMCPKLNSVTFDLDSKMKNVWAWKKGEVVVVRDGGGEDDMGEEGEPRVTEVGGKWDLEFYNVQEL